MAQKVQTLLIDDLDGGEANGTVRFGIDGADYEIDLSAKHAEALRKALAPYLGAARRAPGSVARRSGRDRTQGRQCGRTRPHGGPRMGQVAGHRRQGPRTGTSRAGNQVQGRGGPGLNTRRHHEPRCLRWRVQVRASIRTRLSEASTAIVTSTAGTQRTWSPRTTSIGPNQSGPHTAQDEEPVNG